MIAWTLYLIGTLFVVAAGLSERLQTRPSDGKRAWVPFIAAAWPILALGYVVMRLLRKKPR